ncbi:MAG: AAA family ATPase [Deltaproteobacteria bacterium]|nr:AAA family ATPase [Deltaproteobacteria bacterium]
MSASQSAQAWPAGGDSAFVGREPELHALRAAFDRLASTRGHVVLVSGEPGIGKTRLAVELERIAVERGARVLWGRCWEGDGAPPFWPWTQVLRNDVGLVMPPPLRRVAAFEPPEPPVAADSHARFELFDSVTQFLKTASVAQPLVLILDDLHRADEASLRLFGFLTHELRDAPLLVLGTYRDTEVGPDHPLSRLFAEIAAESERIPLQRLSESEVKHLIECTTGQAPSAALLAAVYDHTEGNPFFVIEIVRLLVSTGRLHQPDEHAERPQRPKRRLREAMNQSISSFPQSSSGNPSCPIHTHGCPLEDCGHDGLEPRVHEQRLGIPPGVRALIRQWRERVSSEAQRLLAVAAVIGREFELPALHRALATANEAGANRVLAAIDEAVEVGLVSAGRGIGRCSFSHALVHETFYEDLTTAERIALHRRVAEAIEAVYAADLDAHAAELAHHFFQAIPAGTAAKATHYAIRTAEQAAAVFAHEDAITHYAQALAALVAHTGLDAEEMARRRCEILRRLGEAQGRAGNLAGARASLLEAVAIARALRSPDLLAWAALGFTAIGSDINPNLDAELVSIGEEALAGLGAGDTALRARLLGGFSAMLCYAGNAERGAVLSREAVAVAERLGDPGVLVDVLNDAQFALTGSPDVETRLALAERALALTRQAGARERALDVYLYQVSAFLQRGDAVAADVALRSCADLAQAMRRPFYVWRVAVVRAMRALLHGAHAEAEDLAHQALAVGQRAQSVNARLAFATQLFGLRRDQGRLEELEGTARWAVDEYPAIPGLHCALALLYSELGRATEARAEFERFGANDFAALPRDANWLNVLDKLAQVCAFLHDAPRAARLYKLLLPYAEHAVVVAFGDACDGAAARSLGLLAATMGRCEEAARHFETALGINAQLGARPFVARTQHQYAELLLSVPSPQCFVIPAVSKRESILSGPPTPGCPLEDCGHDESEVRGQALPFSGGVSKGAHWRESRLSEGRGEGPFSDRGTGGHVRDQALALLDQAIATYEQLGMTGYLQQAITLREQALALPGEPQNVFRFDGKRWTVVWQGQPVRARRASGLHYIAHLLRNPAHGVSIIDLERAVASVSGGHTGAEHRLDEDHLQMLVLGGGEPALDAHAMRQCRERLRELQGEREEAVRLNDHGRLAAIDAECDAIERRLRRRRIGSEVEKLRKRISNAIHRSIRAITRQHPALGQHLHKALGRPQHGTWCYRPAEPIEWEL